MTFLETIDSELKSGRGPYRMFNPSLSSLVSGNYYLAIKTFEITRAAISLRRSGAEWPELIGNELGTQVLMAGRRPIRRFTKRLHRSIPNIPKKDFKRKNGLGGRYWYNEPSQQDLIIVFHDANRAGPHLDIHIGRLSLVYRVKADLYSQLKYNNKGYLTENSKQLLLNHIKAEAANHSRVPQNLDHSKTAARSSWVNGHREGKNYGAGPTRQIISESRVDIYKAHHDGPIEIYAPILNPHRSMYLYKLYSGEGKTAPILIFGNKENHPPPLDDRLHLKMIDPADEEKILKSIDPATITAKYDGSATYLVITPKGTTAWSPRQSVLTGNQIEYTAKLDGVANVHSDETIIAMGELVFKRDSIWNNRGPKLLLRSSKNLQSNNYLSAAEGSGLLNSNALLPPEVAPELRLYRVDKIGRTKTGDLPFWENRALQEQVAKLDPEHFKVVELMSPETAAKLGYEGFVAAPPGGSVNDGFKVKWFEDHDDWRITRIDFKPGENGGLAGVTWFEDLATGREFKLGPGAVGNRELTEHMMHEPDKYIGTVFKVQSRKGHLGRASRVVREHDDKGSSPR